MLFEPRRAYGDASTQLRHADFVATLAPLILVFTALVAFGANSRWLLVLATVGNFAVSLAVILAIGPTRSTPSARVAWMAIPFALSLVCAVVPTLWDAQARMSTPNEAMLVIAHLCGLAALAAAGMTIAASARRRAMFGDGLLAFGVVYLATAIATRAIDMDHVWGYPHLATGDRFTATMLNANAAACVCGMIALIGFGQLRTLLADGYLFAASNATHLRVAAATLCVAIGLGACAITQSRFGLFATLLIMLVQGARDVRSMASRRTKGALAIGTFGLIMLLALGLGEGTMARTALLAEDTHSRLAVYETLVRLSVERPWTGFGLGSFVNLDVQRVPMDILATSWNWGAAHNIVLDAALSGGWPFAILLTTSLVAMSLGSWRRASRRHAGLQGVNAAIILAVAFSMIDIALNVPAIANLTALLVGITWGAGLHAPPRPDGRAG